MFTILACITITSDEPGVNKPRATIVLPDQSVHVVTLHDHDWTYDWSKDRPPASLYRWLRHNWRNDTLPHGDRIAYESDHWNGTSNEKGRMTVFEIEYDS